MFKLTKIVFTGPAEALTQTANTQPALFTIEAAITDVLAEMIRHHARYLLHAVRALEEILQIYRPFQNLGLTTRS